MSMIDHIHLWKLYEWHHRIVKTLVKMTQNAAYKLCKEYYGNALQA